MAKRLILWGIPVLLLVLALAYSFRPQPVPVDLMAVEPGPLQVSIDEEGITRVRDVFVVSAPVPGRVLRIDAEVGDTVAADRTVVAQIEPIDASLLDPRSRAQAQADLDASEAALALARAEVEQARAELEYARTELQRVRRLFADNSVSEAERDAAERNYRIRDASYATALAQVDLRGHEVERARAQLMSPTQGRASTELCECLPIVAPVDGRVLSVLHESEGVVASGTPLIEIGDPGDLEIVVDLLSVDAVKVEPGQAVIIESWGESEPLEGRVRRVDVVGYTKVSSLGIEEQRVNVIVDITSPREDWVRLGHGYQVEVRILTWAGDRVMKVPLTALFRDQGQWSVFAINNGQAELRTVRIGHRTGLEAEVAEGLNEGEIILIHPDDRIADGTLVSARG